MSFPRNFFFDSNYDSFVKQAGEIHAVYFYQDLRQDYQDLKGKNPILLARGCINEESLREQKISSEPKAFYETMDKIAYDALQLTKVPSGEEQNYLTFHCFVSQSIIRSRHSKIKDLPIYEAYVELVKTRDKFSGVSRLPIPSKNASFRENLHSYFTSPHFYKRFFGLECSENFSKVDKHIKAYNNYSLNQDPQKKGVKPLIPYLKAIQIKLNIGHSFYLAPNLATIEPRYDAITETPGEKDIINYQILNKPVIEFFDSPVPKRKFIRRLPGLIKGVISKACKVAGLSQDDGTGGLE